MNTRQWTLIVVAAAVMSAAGSYWFAQSRGTAPAAAQDRKVLYWYDPMVPNQHFDKPGRSPFMDMQLVPRYADEAGKGSAVQTGVEIDPGVQQNLGIRLATVERGAWSQSIEATGSIGFNQRDVAVVQARANGFVTRVYDLAPGDVVERGAPLVDLLIPEWAGAQAEFLALLDSGEQPLIEAARQRLLLLGMMESVIAKLEETRVPHTTTTVTAPIAGAIDALEVRSGMTVGTGATLIRFNGLATVWLEAAVPEIQSVAVSVGQSAHAELAAFPDETFQGKVTAILPEANVATRTLRVRIELPNRKLRLKPGMYARVHLGGMAQTALLIPSEAVIRTGARNLVMLAAQGRYLPVEVKIGAESDGRTVVLGGLQAGQQIVASGQFLIDSEASLSGLRAESNGQSATPSAAEMYSTRGKIQSISAQEIVIAHEPVAALGWPAMSMSFKLASPQQAQDLQVGDRIDFRFRKAGEDYVFEQAAKIGVAP